MKQADVVPGTGRWCEMHEEMIERLQADVVSLNAVIRGNGREGLMERVSKIEASLGMAKWIVGLAAGSLITGVINIAIVLLRHQ